MDLGLTGRVFLVSGGSRGLGRATAEVLVAEGARVVLSGRDPATIRATTDALGTDRAIGLPLDNGDRRGPERLIATAVAKFGRIDGALISVGGPPAGASSQVTDDQWREAFETVFLGSVRLARAVASAVAGDGSIAFVLSSSVKVPIPGLGLSNGLRPGLAMVAKEMSVEFGPRGMRVNALLPGRIDTDRIRQLDADGDDAGATRRATATIPLGRNGRPEEFGRVAAFLLSPAASYLSGVMLSVDGGATRAL